MENFSTNQTNDYLIKKTLQRYMVPTILAILGTTAVQFINTLLAGRYLGSQALTAMNLLSSFTFLFAMFGCLINIGASARASVSMGQGNETEVGEYETVAFIASFLMPVLTSVLILFFLKPFMFFIGCDEALFSFMKSYAQIMLAFGFLTTMMYFPFNFLRLDGRTQIPMFIFIMMGVIDVVLLIIFLENGWGLDGVAWATVISTAVADIVGVVILFFGKKRQFGPQKVRFKRAIALLMVVCKVGAASGLNNLCNMFRTLVMNFLVLNYLGTDAASAFAVACSIIAFAAASVFGCGQTVAPLAGVFYGERDYFSIRLLMKSTRTYSFCIHGIIFVIIALCAGPIAEFFGIHDAQVLSDASFAIRMAALSLIPAAIVNVYIFFYTAIGENKIALILTFLRAFLLVVLISMLFFVTGAGKWYMFAFPIAEIVSVGCMIALAAMKRKKHPELKGVLLLKEEQKEGENIYAFSVQGSTEGAVLASELMEVFCEKNDIDPRFAMSLPLALEELLVIMNEHCLGGDEKKFANVRIMVDEEGIVFRIRCGGPIFDPIKWYRDKVDRMTPEELLEDESLGIRLITKKAKNIVFKRTLGVNNLIVQL